jgi:hypothetical protein
MIAAEDLRDVGEPGCDMAGSSVLFPNSMIQGISAVGAVSSSSTSEEWVTTVNWGVPGVSAYIESNGEITKSWATSKAAGRLQLQLEYARSQN